MSTADALLRADLRTFSGYRSARSEAAQGRVWLNANESAWSNLADPDAACRRYPDPQPAALVSALAAMYGVDADEVLVGRGSDEGIDLLVRTFCMPGQGRVVIAPPVFGMYAVCARLHGVGVVEVPLVEGSDGFAPDLDAMGDAALCEGATVLFLCSPGNPTGDSIALTELAVLATRLQGRCLVVVDEAYGEFADTPSAATLLDAHDNIVVLRTLSKAHALAGARVGCVLAPPELVALLRRCQAPYPIPRAGMEIAVMALAPAALTATRGHVETIRAARESMAATLAALPGVRHVYPSQANFLLVRFDDPAGVLDRLLAAGIVVRDMRAMPGLGDALRITLGDDVQNVAVLSALEAKATRMENAA